MFMFIITFIVAMIKGMIVLSLITALIAKIPVKKLASWMLRGYLHPASIFVCTMAICALISLFSGESADAGIANLLSSIILAGVFPPYTRMKRKALLDLTA